MHSLLMKVENEHTHIMVISMASTLQGVDYQEAHTKQIII